MRRPKTSINPSDWSIHHPSIIHYPLSIIHYPLSIIHYPLSILHYPLSIFLLWMSFRVLIGITDRSSDEDVSSLLSSTGVDLLISRVLRPGDPDVTERAQSVQRLYSTHSQTRLAWSLGGRTEGHLASLVGPALVKLHQLLLLTLPGTPVFNYGDEIGLMDEVRIRYPN